MELKPLGKKRGRSIAAGIVAARTALEQSEGRQGRAGADRAAIWYWDLASGRVEWDERLKALFGYVEMVTDATWREARIHPRDRGRVTTSLQRATIAHPGAVWSEQYRFRQADGSYAAVTERAHVLNDDAGPRAVLGAIRRKSAGRLTRRRIRSRPSGSEPAARERPRG